MPQVLDLSVNFTPPPAGADPDVLAHISLHCDTLGLNHSGDLLRDPLSPQEREDLQWYLEEYWKWPYEQFRERGKHIEHLLPALGKRLYEAIFGTVRANNILQAWRLQSNVLQQISIMSAIPAVLSLPWELLHDEQGFLILRNQPVSLIRRLPQQELATRSTSFQPPFRILLVTARPEGTGFIDPRSTARHLFDEMQEQMEAGAVAIEVLRPSTLPALRHRLRDTTQPVHLLHFDGHGTFGEMSMHQDEQHKSDGEQGKLAFEDAENRLALVEASTLAQVLQDSGVHLVVLDACQSALGAADDAFSSVAARLIQGGIDAVIAMSASVLVVSSARYMGAFYRELAQGTPVPIAQERARQALHDDPRRHRSRRRHDEEGTLVELRDWWLPHYYQQRPLMFSSIKPARTRTGKKRHTQAPPARLSEHMPGEPRYGFRGRARELLLLERALLQGQLVVVHGFGGAGKTALVREAADWFTRTHLYEGACFISFEQGGGALTVLSTLGRYLNVYDGDYNPAEVQAALARLQAVLRTTKVLVIADNLESILAQGEVPLEPDERVQLWDTLLALRDMGAGVILTSRDLSFGDGRLAPGQQTCYIPLLGLWPDDAYTLASHILKGLGIPRTRAPYAELCTLLAELDHHPLAIQLVLPALHDHSLATIHADFATLLPTFVDDTATGANRSLLASLDYSLRRLPSEHRQLLPRLAIFAGGANELSLLEITQIPAKVWGTLRPALEQVALLVAESIHPDLSTPFLHFHPVLVPYLRQHVGVQDDEALRRRYVGSYIKLAFTFRMGVDQHPEPIYALGRRELPNLRTAMAYLLQAEESDAASLMASWLCHLLDRQGLLRERDRLRQRVDQLLKTSASAELTIAAYSSEVGQASDELHSGKIRAALTRLTKLLARMQELPDGGAIGPGSYSHAYTLQLIGQCLCEAGQYLDAWQHLQRALDSFNAQLEQEPKNHILHTAHANLLGDLGKVRLGQGLYAEAQAYLEQALGEHLAMQDVNNAASTLAELGNTALYQQNYPQARSYYQRALQQFQARGDLEQQAKVWHQLGTVALEQRDWSEAERCYRESLALCEHIGYIDGAAGACYQLGFVAKGAGRPEEAERWFKSALERIKRVEPGGRYHAKFLNTLANLLTGEVQAGRAERSRLVEARSYLEQCLRIEEQTGATDLTAKIYNLLSRIAEMEGQPEQAHDYRRRERESFAASADIRFRFDGQFASLIADIVAAAHGDAQARAKVMKELPAGEQNGWHISAGVQRIWQGERDREALTEDLDAGSALLLLRVLERLAEDE